MKKLLLMLGIASTSCFAFTIGDTLTESQINSLQSSKNLSTSVVKVVSLNNATSSTKYTLNTQNKVIGIDYDGKAAINFESALGPNYYPDFLTTSQTRVNRFNHNSLNVVTNNVIVVSSGLGGKVFKTKIILTKESE